LKLNLNNKRLQTQEGKNINVNNNYINSILSGANSYKDSNSNLKTNDENNNRINNNIKVQNINNYIIDVHKYKINLIGNSNYYKNMNLIEFYKKLHIPKRYNKFISDSNKKNITTKNDKNDNNNNIFIKQNYNNFINSNNNKRNINKYISSEKKNINSKLRHLSDLNLSTNNHATKNQVNQVNIKSEAVEKIKSPYHNKKENSKIQKRNIKLNVADQKITKSKSDEKDKAPSKLKLKKKLKKYSPLKFQSEHSHKIKNKIKIPNRNPNKNIDSASKTFFTTSIIKENISLNKEHIPNKTDNDNNTDLSANNNINNKNIKNDKIKNLKLLSIKNNQNKIPLNKKGMIYHKKFINLNKRKNNSVENEHHKKKYNLDISNLNNINHQNYSLISLYSNQIRNNVNIEKIKKKIMSNIPNVNNNNSLSSFRKNQNNITRKKRFFSQERAKKYSPIKLNSNPGISKDVNFLNNYKNSKKENTKHISNNKDPNYNNLNNLPSLICCKSSIKQIKEVVKKVFASKLYAGNNGNNSMINTFYLNSNAILRCKLINKFYNLYFELHISFYKDSQKYVLIKPNLLKGNKLIFMKLFEKIKNELLK